jgi:hypothetical protein
MTHEELAINASKIGTYGGSFAGVMSWLSNNSGAITAVVAIASLMIAIGSFFLRIYLELKEEKRKEIVFEQVQEERREHKKRDNGKRERITDK